MVDTLTRQNGPRYFNHPLIKKDCIEFRSYQNNISESVRNKNSLVILPTALGKTVIAIFVCAEKRKATIRRRYHSTEPFG